MPSDRYMPMNWAPRWLEAYYNSDSLLRKLYFLGSVYYKEELMELLTGNIVPGFFGKIYDDSLVFTAKYIFPERYVPHIKYFVGSSSGTVTLTNTYGNYVYDKVNPIACVYNELLWLKNLEVRIASAMATSGYLNLSTVFNQEAITLDSPVVVENSYGDQKIVDQTSINFLAGSGITGFGDGTYLVYYRSAARVSGFLDGSNYITIDNEKVNIFPTHISNKWDEYASFMGIKRKDRESNLSLKSKAQHLTIAKRANQKIAAALGTTNGLAWTATGTIASGYIDWEFMDYNRFDYISELPIKVSDYFALTFIPTGWVQLFIKGRPIESSAYQISGSFILPVSGIFQGVEDADLLINYKTEFMASRNPVETGPIVAINKTIDSYYGIGVQSVRTISTSKKIKPEEWRWNINLGQLDGIAEFDF